MRHDKQLTASQPSQMVQVDLMSANLIAAGKVGPNREMSATPTRIDAKIAARQIDQLLDPIFWLANDSSLAQAFCLSINSWYT